MFQERTMYSRSRSIIQAGIMVVLVPMIVLAYHSYWNVQYASKSSLKKKARRDLPSYVDDGTEAMPLAELGYPEYKVDLQSINNVDCFTPECFRREGEKLARVWKPKPKEDWCRPTPDYPREFAYTDDRRADGLILCKSPKAASSSTAAIALRISNQTQCAAHWRHLPGYHWQNRTSNSFLFTSIRPQPSHAMSFLNFFELFLRRKDNNNTKILFMLDQYARRAESRWHGGQQYGYISLEKMEEYDGGLFGREQKGKAYRNTAKNQSRVADPESLRRDLKAVLDGYDFMFVTDRMDESSVALAMLTGLKLTDVVLASSSKVSGSGYSLSRYAHTFGCNLQPKVKSTPSVEEMVASDRWKLLNQADYLIHAAANISLDRTIDEVFGREAFEANLAELRRLKKVAADHCGERLGSGCTSSGEIIQPMEKCYEYDFQCGYECIDEALGTTPVVD